jgi:hypothetical protein
LVRDNLNTHKPVSIYEAFPAAQARRLVERFEWALHPKTWLSAGYDRIRTRRSLVSVTRPTHPYDQTLTEEAACLAAAPQQKQCQSGLAVQNNRRWVKLKRLYPAT